MSPLENPPGIAISETPSGARPIAGAPTSIAAFIGLASQGPTDRALLVQSWSDFERQFGGLDPNSYLGYAVGHFFANGGAEAYVARLTTTGTAAVMTAAP